MIKRRERIVRLKNSMNMFQYAHLIHLFETGKLKLELQKNHRKEIGEIRTVMEQY
jgi:hypothetical protein